MDVTPQELRDIEIREAWRGYHRDDVDELLERAAATIEHLEAETQQLRAAAQGGHRPAPRAGTRARAGRRARAASRARSRPAPPPIRTRRHRRHPAHARPGPEGGRRSRRRGAAPRPQQLVGDAEARAKQLVSEAEANAAAIAERERSKLADGDHAAPGRTRHAQRRRRRARALRAGVPRPAARRDRGRARAARQDAEPAESTLRCTTSSCPPSPRPQLDRRAAHRRPHRRRRRPSQESWSASAEGVVATPVRAGARGAAAPSTRAHRGRARRRAAWDPAPAGGWNDAPTAAVVDDAGDYPGRRATCTARASTTTRSSRRCARPSATTRHSVRTTPVLRRRGRHRGAPAPVQAPALARASGDLERDRDGLAVDLEGVRHRRAAPRRRATARPSRWRAPHRRSSRRGAGRRPRPSPSAPTTHADPVGQLEIERLAEVVDGADELARDAFEAQRLVDGGVERDRVAAFLDERELLVRDRTDLDVVGRELDRVSRRPRGDRTPSRSRACRDAAPRRARRAPPSPSACCGPRRGPSRRKFGTTRCSSRPARSTICSTRFTLSSSATSASSSGASSAPPGSSTSARGSGWRTRIFASVRAARPSVTTLRAAVDARARARDRWRLRRRPASRRGAPTRRCRRGSSTARR